MKNKKIIYYEDELNDEVIESKITPINIDENYVYIHKNPLWNITSIIIQNVLSMPIKIGYAKTKFRIKYIGKEKLKKAKREGYFVYANHTQVFADTFIPSIPIYPKRNFFIVDAKNVSMGHTKTLIEMLGAIPIPNNKNGMKNFLKTINKRIEQNYSITIYPEAHIWPYYTKIRPFKDVSFKYPVKLNKPVFCVTNTYQSYGKNKNHVKMVTYIDGPFFADKNLTAKEQQQDLRDRVYKCMTERSKNSNIEVIEYRKMISKEKELSHEK